MNRPWRSSTETGVVTRFVSTLISSSSRRFLPDGGGGDKSIAASSGGTVVRFFTAGDFLGADVRVSSFRAGLAWRGRVWATADEATTARQSDNKTSLYISEGPP